MPTLLPPAAVAEKIRTGAILVDIREPDEFAREHIAGALNLPLSKISNATLPQGKEIVFSCKTGHRTSMNQQALTNLADADCTILQGGLEGWKSAGLPTAVNTRQPIEMMRQVQVAAGSLVLAGAILGAVVSPLFYGLSGAVGAGLMISGISGTCAMAGLLRNLPWNRKLA